MLRPRLPLPPQQLRSVGRPSKEDRTNMATAAVVAMATLSTDQPLLRIALPGSTGTNITLIFAGPRDCGGGLWTEWVLNDTRTARSSHNLDPEHSPRKTENWRSLQGTFLRNNAKPHQNTRGPSVSHFNRKRESRRH